jgi:hypothetical protein
MRFSSRSQRPWSDRRHELMWRQARSYASFRGPSDIAEKERTVMLHFLLSKAMRNS